ncbi:MAG: succinate dehydrogenase, partial [Acidobacteriaceae bacterium]
MAAAATPAAPTNSPRIKRVQPLRAGEGHSFFWRRLHSLSGIVPIGAFLVEHIVSNFEAVNGPLAYAQQVKFLNGLPLVRVLEWAFIFIPLLFHAGYGVFIWLRGRSNVNLYPWAGNVMYLMQRVTGLIAFAYIVQHVWRQRFSGINLPEHPGAAFHKVQVELHNPWMLAVYIIAMVATCWHFAYGIWLFAAKWGITPGDRARKRFGYVCAVGGSALCVLGLVGMYAFINPKYANAPE